MEEEKFAEIIDAGECMTTLYEFPQIPWPEPFLKEVANKRQWSKDNFYPSNNLVGEIVYIIEKDMSLRIDIVIYILFIDGKYFVPISAKGFKFISKSDYQTKVHMNKIQDMNSRQKDISEGWESYKERIAYENSLTAAQRIALFIRRRSVERD